LVGPELLYARQKDRAVWFGLLIAAAALAALLGVVSSWRAFRQQHQLARMQSNFLSSVSHELRAPIASVRLMAEGLEQNRVTEPNRRQEYFHFIVQECRRLSGLIENVLNVSRIEQGKQQYTFEPTDLRRLVEDTVQLMQPAARERHIEVTFDFPSCALEPPELDGPSIQQALINLIDNAIKHSPDNETIVVSLEIVSGAARPASVQPDEAEPNTDKRIQLIVADHGPGIPSEDHERIFERFYRRGTELRRSTQGVGIGLHIVKRTTDAHGGRVWVECGERQGSRFVMELPLKP
jgi:signal transduction histidine kinase